MKILKSAIAIIMTIIIAASCAAIAGAAVKETTKSITVTQNKDKTIKIKDNSKYDGKYYVKVTKGDKKAVEVDFTGWEGDKALFCITGREITKKPVTVKIIRKSYHTGKKTTFKTLKVTVKKAEQKRFRTIKLSIGKNLTGVLNRNGFADHYKLKIKDTSIVKCKHTSYGYVEIYDTLNFDTFKAGTTEADVYVRKTKVGTVKIKVGDYKPYLCLKDNTLTLKYSNHGRAKQPEDMNLVNLNADLYENLTYKTDSEYFDCNMDSEYLFTTKKTGKTTLTILNGKEEIGTFDVNIVEAKMAEVYENNRYGDGDSDNLYYGNNLSVSNKSKTFNLFTKINNVVLNNKSKGTSFKKSDYKITYSTKDTKYVKVSKKGVVTVKKNAAKKGTASIKYTIKFADKSKYTDNINIVIE